MQNRRTFLQSLSSLTAGIIINKFDAFGKLKKDSDRLGELLPKRRFGKTGIEVTMLGVGGAHIGRSDEKTAQAIIEKALEGGIRFFDNAESYNQGRAEKYYGQFLCPKYRDIAYIMTKTTASDAQTARIHLEGSLRRLNTDYIDLWQIHSIRNPKDVDDRLDKGVLDVVLEAQEKGMVKHIGFTGHTDYQAHVRMLEVNDVLQTCQMPQNIFDPNYKSFIRNVLPVLVEKDYGVIAMKTLANGGFFGGTRHFRHGEHPKIVPEYATIQQALHFVWSLPVSVIVTGAESPEMLQEKIELAHSFSKMKAEEREKLIDRVAGFDGTKVEFYKTV